MSMLENFNINTLLPSYTDIKADWNYFLFYCIWGYWGKYIIFFNALTAIASYHTSKNLMDRRYNLILANMSEIFRIRKTFHQFPRSIKILLVGNNSFASLTNDRISKNRKQEFSQTMFSSTFTIEKHFEGNKHKIPYFFLRMRRHKYKDFIIWNSFMTC